MDTKVAPYGTIPQTGHWDIAREHPTFISDESAEFTFWMHDHRAGTNGAVPCNVVLETRFYGDDTRDKLMRQARGVFEKMLMNNSIVMLKVHAQLHRGDESNANAMQLTRPYGNLRMWLELNVSEQLCSRSARLALWGTFKAEFVQYAGPEAHLLPSDHLQKKNVDDVVSRLFVKPELRARLSQSLTHIIESLSRRDPPIRQTQLAIQWLHQPTCVHAPLVKDCGTIVCRMCGSESTTRFGNEVVWSY